LNRVKSLDGPRVRGISPVGKERSMKERICRRAKSWVQNKYWASKRRCKRW